MAKVKDKKYSQKFRIEWLNNSLMKDWLVEEPSADHMQCRCRYCKSNINSWLSDLLAHAKTKLYDIILTV